MSTQGNRPGALRITGTGLPGGTTVELDGEDVTGALTGLSLQVGVGCRPTATLGLNVRDLSTEVENPRIVMTEKTRDLLARLGWTPPAEEAT
ncbi:MAG TPA: hypothetical protein VHU40_06225 [Polyangia bacterium]|jgi:hypothetical protein|nr:hypothetical protein [Polyangia bacterium]